MTGHLGEAEAQRVAGVGSAKRQNQQWPSVGRFLWEQSNDKDHAPFVAEMLKAFGVGA